jgi:hypothetical protein
VDPRTALSAFDEAKRLDYWWVGDEHVLLSLLGSRSVACDILEGLGVTYEMVLESIRRWDHDVEVTGDRQEGLKPAPVFYGFMGRAEVFAAFDGKNRPSSEHLLLALVWSDTSGTSLLHSFGVSQAAVLDELRRRGVTVPGVEPPWYRPSRGRAQLTVAEDELQALLDLLNERHPAGSECRWGFNWTRDEPRQAWVSAEEGIDLEALAGEARDRTA